MSLDVFVWGLKPRHLWRYFWDPKNRPITESARINPIPLGWGRALSADFYDFNISSTVASANNFIVSKIFSLGCLGINN